MGNPIIIRYRVGLKPSPCKRLPVRGNRACAEAARPRERQMSICLRRREFIVGLGSAAAWPLAAKAQQPGIPVIGVLSLGSPDPNPWTVALRRGLAEVGYSSDVAIEYRWANNQPSLLPSLADDLVSHKVAVIVTGGSPYAALAAKAATSTIPIVFLVTDDPRKYGLVARFDRPGGNVTGVNNLGTELAGKLLNLLVELVPQAIKVGYLSIPSSLQIVEDMKSDILGAGRALEREIIVLEVRGLDFEAAFATLVEQRAAALVVGNHISFLDSRNRDKILEMAARHKLPAIYHQRQYVINGGLMSYEADNVAAVRQVASYVGQILKGAKPGDLPVQQPIRFELVLNLKTAKELGLTVPPTLYALATEVIE
jgi:putative ABC transport system substrate-binding protein